jgi:hypothetical protein
MSRKSWSFIIWQSLWWWTPLGLLVKSRAASNCCLAKRYGDVCKQYQLGIRIPNCTFKHHQVIAVQAQATQQ